MTLILFGAGFIVVCVAVAAAGADAHQRYLESLPAPPPHIKSEARALDGNDRAGVMVGVEIHYYDRELKKEIVTMNSHAVKVI
ncbi:hypothetical protein HY631_02625 [Candidatus Uhrbacteria bacterium]|nr:hypothetical protein [Candidatus Uhrbacteria bacterium]